MFVIVVALAKASASRNRWRILRCVAIGATRDALTCFRQTSRPIVVATRGWATRSIINVWNTPFAQLDEKLPVVTLSFDRRSHAIFENATNSKFFSIRDWTKVKYSNWFLLLFFFWIGATGEWFLPYWKIQLPRSDRNVSCVCALEHAFHRFACN